MTATAKLQAAQRACLTGSKVFLRDVGAGLLNVGHNSLALVGLCVVCAALFANSREDLRSSFEGHALDWLQARQVARTPPPPVLMIPGEPDAVTRATALDPQSLPRQQAAVANWISRRYRVAPEPISRLVQEAWAVGKRVGLDPTLILAVMAVESSFNPFAQSHVGAQGLMQVMTHIHDDKYEAFGGIRAAFDPVSNLRVGVQVLRDCINRAGGTEAGLKWYVGAANSGLDGGYAAKVMAEQNFLDRVAQGKTVAVNATAPQRPVASAEPSTLAPATAVVPAAPAAASATPEAPAGSQQVALLQ